MGIGRVALGIEGCYLFINYIFGRKIVGGVIWILYLDENLVEFGVEGRRAGCSVLWRVTEK